MTQTKLSLPDLYLEDETAWLEAMAERIRKGTIANLDYSNLGEYLSDMAKRDRREVESRLVVLLMHILKWVHQPDHRSGSWRSSIIEQRQELVRLASGGILRNHAEAVLHEVYAEALERAAAETGLPSSAFPTDCEFAFDELLAFDPA